MTTYTTPLPRADQTGPEADEPARRASRFDERGIALQTVIIMVVLLAIAGGVAAVLFSRGQTAQEQLENTNVAAIDYTTIKSKALCDSAGGDWHPEGDGTADLDGDGRSNKANEKDLNCTPPSA